MNPRLPGQEGSAALGPACFDLGTAAHLDDMPFTLNQIALNTGATACRGSSGGAAPPIALAQMNSPSGQTRRDTRATQSQAAQMLLRRTLQQHWGAPRLEPWTLGRTAAGQPVLNGPSPPSVSLAHSGPWIACAAAESGQVGIDVEAIRPRDWEAMAPMFLHPIELGRVLSAAPEERDLQALLLWCRKEALGKALGVGISESAVKIAFSAEGDLLALPHCMGSSVGWNFYCEVPLGRVVIAAAWR